MTYGIDQEWETSWIPHVLPLISAKHLLEKAPIEKDQNEVTDIMPSMMLRNVRIGLRMRRPEYFDKYSGEITFRSNRETGAKTEFAKILEGWGDLMFYGFANPHWKSFRSVRQWTLISLRAVRRIVKSHNPRLTTIDNRDGTSFHPIKIKDWKALDKKFVIDSNWEA